MSEDSEDEYYSGPYKWVWHSDEPSDAPTPSLWRQLFHRKEVKREWEEYHRRKTEEWEEKERAKKAEVEEEQANAYSENKKIVDAIAGLLSSSGPQVLEMIQGVRALEGGNGVPSPGNVMSLDITEILANLAKANGAIPDGFERLYHATRRKLDPTFCFRVSYCHKIIEDHDVDPPAVPSIVKLLAMYDKAQKTNLASNAAAVYYSLVSSAAGFCGTSVGVKLVADTYIRSLRPYLLGGPERPAGSSGSSNSTAHRQCTKCEKYHLVLGLKEGATEAEIKQTYKDLVNVWHPDRFHHDQRLRQKTEERFKDIQEAYDHVIQHFQKDE